MGTWLVSFLLFFLFLIVIPVGPSPFEVPKTILAEIIIEVLLLIKIISFKKEGFKKLLSPQLIFIALLFILSVDQRFLFNPAGSFFGNIFRLQGVLLFWHLLLFALLSKDYLIDQKVKLLAPLAFICLLMGTLILGVNLNGRAFGTLGEPNALATTTVFLFPFVFLPYSKKYLKVITLAAAFTIILLSGSKAGLTALLIQLTLITLYQNFRLSLNKTVIISLILASLTFILPFTQTSSWFENRGAIWQTAFQAGWQSPLLGHGFGNIQKPIHDMSSKLNNPVQYQVVDSSHNFLLDFWVQGGLVGLLCILILIGLTIQNYIRNKKLLELTAFLGLLTAMLFNPVSVVNLLAFWWLIGQGAEHST